ncbi:MAG: TetR/AcrR family transcriptional regulator [Acidimicrobiia bacterium]
MAAATELFSEKGFLATTTQELADAVGLVKGTLYYHIGSKTQLLYQIHQHVTEEGSRRWEEILEGADGRETPDVIEEMIIAHCEIMHEYRAWVAVFSEEVKHLPPEYARQVRRSRAAYQEQLRRVLQRGMAEGDLVPGDSRTAALILMGTLNSMYRWYSPKGRLSARRIGEVIASIALDGISAHR